MLAGFRGARVACVVVISAVCSLCVCGPAAAAPSWGAATPISASDPLLFPTVEMSAGGEAIAAWVRTAGSRRLEVAIAAPGGRFAGPRPLSNPAKFARLERLVVLGDGTAYVFWVEAASENDTPLGGRLFVAMRRPGGQFGVPRLLSSPTYRAGVATVAVAPDGALAVGWNEERPAPESPLRFALAPRGGSFSAPIGVDVPGAALAALAIDRSHVTTLLWTRTREEEAAPTAADRIDLYATTGSPQGSFTDPQLLSRTSGFGVGAILALAPSGEVGALWAEGLPVGSQVRAAFRSPGGGFGPVQTLADPLDSVRNAGLDLRYDREGRALAFFANAGVNFHAVTAVFGAVRFPGGRFGAPVQLGLAAHYPPPLTTLTARGAFVALWGASVTAGLDPDGNVIEREEIVSAAAEPGRSFTGGQLVERDAVSPILDSGGGLATLAAWARADGLRAAVREERSGRFCTQTVAPHPTAGQLKPTGLDAAIASDPRGNATLIFVGKNGVEALTGREDGRAPAVLRLRTRVRARHLRRSRGRLFRGRAVTRFSLSEASSVTVKLSRRRGRRWRRVASTSFAARAGPNRVVIPPASRTLRRGRYRLSVSATDCDRRRGSANRRVALGLRNTRRR